MSANYFNITGINNVSVGYRAGGNSTGSNNVFLGYRAGRDETGSDKLYIANSETTSPLIYGDFTTKKLTINDILNVAPRATAPLSPVKGDVYYDSTIDKLRCWDGTMWQNLW